MQQETWQHFSITLLTMFNSRSINMFQKISIIGYLGKEPEMRYTEAGQAVTKLSVATSRKWKDSEGDKQETTWFRVNVWGKQAEACNEYLSKGSLVFIKGRLMPDPKTGSPKMWKGNDDMVHASFEVTAGQVKFLQTKRVEVETGSENVSEPDYEEIPF
jgi:single-strand DNA-binding protein